LELTVVVVKYLYLFVPFFNLKNVKETVTFRWWKAGCQ